MPRNPELYRQITGADRRSEPSKPSEIRKPDATPSSPGRLSPLPEGPRRIIETYRPLLDRPSGS
jgi:hypothetical protein